MEDVAAVRQAALASVEDIEPVTLRDRITDRLDHASLTPGVLTLVAARAATDTPSDDHDGVTNRAAGVQLIYEGLALTRQLADDNPWVAGDRDAADLDILIADILVSRGFSLLAHTDAADDAVDVVRSFGHDQTVSRTTGDETLDGALESDICELAVSAGVTSMDRQPTAPLRTYAGELADDGLPEYDDLLGEDLMATLTGYIHPDRSPPEGTEAAADY
jgi:hypothetical protein